MNLAFKYGFYYFKDFYRFSSLRTRNIVLFFQIYGSIVFFNLMLPLLIFSSQFSEPTRDFYIAISPMYSIWIIFTLVFLPIEKFGHWLWVYLSKKFKLKSSVIQRELEAAMRRKDFDYYHKIPYLMGILTVVMYFSGGMPFLIIMFSPFMFIYFWIEKLMLLKFYRKPKNLDATTLRIADYVIL